MVKHGIKGMIGGGAAAGGAADRVVSAWRDTLAKAGRETELGTDLIIGYSFQIADTEERAIADAKKVFEEHMKMFGPLGFVRGLTDEQIDALGDPRRAPYAGLPTLEDSVKEGSWLCGPPEMIIEKLMAIQDRYPGLQEVNVQCANMGTPLNVTLEQLEWFGKEIMPVFKNQVKSPVAAD